MRNIEGLHVCVGLRPLTPPLFRKLNNRLSIKSEIESQRRGTRRHYVWTPKARLTFTWTVGLAKISKLPAALFVLGPLLGRLFQVDLPNNAGLGAVM